jgi:hypothetical protein
VSEVPDKRTELLCIIDEEFGVKLSAATSSSSKLLQADVMYHIYLTFSYMT